MDADAGRRRFGLGSGMSTGFTPPCRASDASDCASFPLSGGASAAGRVAPSVSASYLRAGERERRRVGDGRRRGGGSAGTRAAAAGSAVAPPCPRGSRWAASTSAQPWRRPWRSPPAAAAPGAGRRRGLDRLLLDAAGLGALSRHIPGCRGARMQSGWRLHPGASSPAISASRHAPPPLRALPLLRALRELERGAVGSSTIMHSPA